MKLPQPPPSHDLTKLTSASLARVINLAATAPANDSYEHWDTLRRKKPVPEGATHEEWWTAIKLQRSGQFRTVPLSDRRGGVFRYLISDRTMRSLHHVDSSASGAMLVSDDLNPEQRDRFIVSSLMEEAISSSLLEGAVATRDDAKRMIRRKTKPRNKSERMIMNNYLAMSHIKTIKHEPLSRELLLHLQQILTVDTLDDPTASGRFRRHDENIVVSDEYGQVFHEPPAAAELDVRVAAMCRFANGETPDHFVHPVLRAIILHFWLAYDHPFCDGNGRTARALFYWFMLKSDYWLFEYISISQVFLKAPTQYARAFLLTETDENDLTYFIHNQFKAIERAIETTHEYVRGKAKQTQQLDDRLGESTMNHRQRALISHALRHPHEQYTIKSHQNSQGVVYQTARTDLLDLVERGLLHSEKIGPAWHFRPASDLERQLNREAR